MPENKTNFKEIVYENVPDSIVPPLIITIYVILILALEASGTYKTNPAIFFGVPILYAIIFIKGQDINVISDILGFSLKNNYAKIIAVVGIAGGALVGFLLAYMATVKKASILIALYPFAFASTTDIASRSSTLLSVSPEVQVIVFIFVAIGEEVFCVFFFKNIANWLYPGITNRINLEIFAVVIARVLWAAMHWFAYNGLSQPIMYLSAIFLGIIFTAVGWAFGILAERLSTEKVFSEKRNFNIPFMIYPAIAAHFVFDVVLIFWMSS